MTKALTPEERELVRMVDEDVQQAEAAGKVIKKETARLIAAAVHRGLDGELERFAATGRLVNHHAARLELFYSLKDEPQFAVWGVALREYMNQDARVKRAGGGRHKLVGKTDARTRHQARHSKSGPDGPLPQANPEVAACPTCSPEGVLIYVCSSLDDAAERQGLALHMQHLACRRFTRRQLHKGLEATFTDSISSRRSGLRRLLAHVAVCHNNRVVVQRLDRLPPDSLEAAQVTEEGARVLSATDQNTRTSRHQAALGRDVAELAKRDGSNDKNPKHAKRTKRSQP
jgi:hypothetical protein